MKKTELKLTVTVNGRALSKDEKSTILAKLKEVLANELGGQKDVQGQEPLVNVCCTGCTGGCQGCTACTSCTGGKQER
jgi:hypothetical protein